MKENNRLPITSEIDFFFSEANYCPKKRNKEKAEEEKRNKKKKKKKTKKQKRTTLAPTDRNINAGKNTLQSRTQTHTHTCAYTNVFKHTCTNSSTHTHTHTCIYT